MSIISVFGSDSYLKNISNTLYMKKNIYKKNTYRRDILIKGSTYYKRDIYIRGFILRKKYI